MKEMFDLDSPLMRGLSELADMILLNILALVCSLPVVTIGASTAGLYTALSGLRKGEGSPVRDFFRAFRSNFKQATALWLILLATGLLLGFSLSFYFYNNLPGRKLLLVLQAIIFLFWAIVFSWSSLLQFRFTNTVRENLRNSLLLGISFILRTVFMIVVDLLPVAVFLLLPGTFLQLGLVWLLIWWSLAARLKLKLFDGPCKRLVGTADPAGEDGADI